ELLAGLGLRESDADGVMSGLPLAQRQLVEIAKVVSRAPRILLFDEPTSALAEREVMWLMALIRRLRDEGRTVVFTSHRWNEVHDISDRITIFRNGQRVGTFAIRGRRVALRHPRDAIGAGIGIALVPEDRKVEGLFLPMSVRQNMTLPVLGALSRLGYVDVRRETDTVGRMIDQLAIRTTG